MVASTVCENNGGTPYRAQTYDYDDASKIKEFKLLDLVTPATLQEIDYAYGATDGILESEDHIGTTNDIEYTYDDFGNILTRKQGSFGSPATSDVYAYSGHDQLDTITRGGTLWKEFFYDSNGRRSSFKEYSSTVQTYTYDDADRITAITYPGATGDTFAYNGNDSRLSKSENGSSTSFYRSGPEVTDSVLSDSGAVHTPGISERRGSTTTFSHSGIKNPAYQSGTSGTQTAEKEYDAYGNVLNSGGSWQGPFGYAGSFGYQSAERSGLMLLGHRSYDPATGRFLTLDPVKSGSNWNAYCNGDMLQNSDGSGLAPWNYRNHQVVCVPEYVPRSVDLMANVKHAEMLGAAFIKSSLISTFIASAAVGEFYDLVKSGGLWDFKRRKPILVFNRLQYEDYGNWHFGVVAAAFGFPRDLALRMAGRAQKNSTPADWLFGGPPYGDDEVDQFWIHCGYNYYEQNLAKNRLLMILCNG